MEFQINVPGVLEVLPTLGLGLLGIFVVTAIIIVVMQVLTKIPSKEEPTE